MKKFFQKTSKERGRRKKEQEQYQDEQDILHGRKGLSTSLGAAAGTGGLNDTSESDRSLLDPRGMVRKKSSSRRVVVTSTSSTASAAPLSSSPPSTSSFTTQQQQQQQQRGGRGRHFMADYTMGSDTNLNITSSSPQSSSSSPPSAHNNNAHQQRQYSPSNNPLSAISTSSSSSSPSSPSQQIMNQHEKDKLMKQRIKEEQRLHHYKSQSSEGSHSSPPSTPSTTTIASPTATTMSYVQTGGGREHMHGVSKGHGGSNYDTPSMNAAARHAGSTSVTTTRSTAAGATAGTTTAGNNRTLSQEEQDKRTKELIKSQRREQSQSVAGYRSGAGGSSSGGMSTMSSSSTSTTSYSRSFMNSSTLGDNSLEEENEEIDHEQYKQLLHPLGGSGGKVVGGNKEGTGGLLYSAMKGRGHQRYSGGYKNERADDNDDEEVEERRVSFAKDKNIDESDHSSDRKSVSFEVVDGDNNKDGGRGGSDFNESDFNIDDCADIIQAASRQFGGDDDPFIHHNNTTPTQSPRGSPNRAQDDDDLRRSNLLDLYKAQFMATSQLSGNLDFDPSELKDIYRQSLGGVEEEDEDTTSRRDQLIRHHTSMESKQSLSHFEEEEKKKNMKRRQSKRMSKHSMRIEAWHQKYSLQRALRVAELTPEMEWLSSFYRCDPRWQIQAFFDEVAREGGDAQMSEDLAASPLALLFNKANVFTVWRPTSDEAIKNMMLGIATGKGLDIKGKSAKRGNISSYVPFIQIYEEPHKEHVRAFLKDGRTIRVFYQSEVSRNSAYEMILDIKDFMLFAAQDAMRILSDEFADEAEQELAMKHLMYDDSNLGVTLVDKYAHASTPVFGLDVTERLFWESYVMMQDCSRPSGSEWDIGRKSEPTFMDFNFKSVRREPGPGEPRAVVYQFSEESPIEPRTLLMAYEEYGMVKPVVSDFDCFLLGSRGVKYKHPIPPNQVELVKWSVNNISDVLDERAASQSDTGWMAAWFKVLKKAAMRNYVPITPKYGNGDPKSYEIIEVAVSRLQGTGCVRHGAECFNWYFPQEIDDEFLVISDTLPGNVKWKKMNVFELQEILMTKIDEGFTFPLNPKWVLCDPGWRRVYDKLLASQKRNVQDSINCWLPPETGLREQIDAISKRHPLGFEGRVYKVEGTEVMDKMEEELERYRRVQALWRKARALVWWIIFLNTKSQTIRLEAMQRQYQR